MEFFKKIFRRKREAQTKPQPLRIEGCKTTLTPKPDEAELAAEALLEMMCDGRWKMEDGRGDGRKEIAHGTSSNSTCRDVQYYRELSEKIHTARAAERRLTMRYLAYCEEQLALPQPLYVGQIGEMEQELYKRQDVAEREGGELLRRWQHCLAECIVRQMSEAYKNNNEEATTNLTNGTN